MEPRRSVHESASDCWGGLFPHREGWHASVFRRLMSRVIDRGKAFHLSKEIGCDHSCHPAGDRGTSAQVQALGCAVAVR